MSRSGRHDGPDGIAVVDKEAGWTSHDVVAKARGILGTRKVGHSGTLDPDATGVLVLGVGRGTRVLRFLTLLPKTYEATIAFGVETSTLDAAGEVTATHDMSGLRPEDVLVAVGPFLGDIEQIPPMVSAIKVDGKRLYELARDGIEIERAPRPVHVSRFDLVPTEDPLRWRATVDCSSGTYIRSLAADLGRALGGGAHLAELRRTAVGRFTLDDARSLESVEVIDLSEAARGFDVVAVDESMVAAIAVGKVFDRGALDAAGIVFAGEGPWPVVDPGGRLIAWYVAHSGGRVKPAVMLIDAAAH